MSFRERMQRQQTSRRRPFLTAKLPCNDRFGPVRWVKKRREVIRDFEAVRLQPHTTVGIVFNQARMFLPLSKHDCGHTSERMAG